MRQMAAETVANFKLYRRGVGDCAGAEYHETHLLEIPTEREAQTIADFFCDLMEWERIRVMFWSEPTYRLRAKVSWDDGWLRLYRIGRTVGVLIHELAHHEGWKHDSEFQRCQRMLLTKWDENHEALEAKVEAEIPKPPPMVWVTPKEIDEVIEAGATVIVEAEEEDEVLEIVFDQLMDSVIFERVSMKRIGELLLKWRLNTEQNIRFMKDLLKDAGVRVVSY